jgi:hypothetical protein
MVIVHDRLKELETHSATWLKPSKLKRSRSAREALPTPTASTDRLAAPGQHIGVHRAAVPIDGD